MSFFTLVPNYTSNMARFNAPFQFRPQINVQSTLSILSTALRTSILSYQKHFVAANRTETVENKAKVQFSATTNKKQRSEAKSKEQGKQSYFSNVIQKTVIQQKIKSSSTTNIKSSPIIFPNTIDQCSISKLQGAIDSLKTQNAKQVKQQPKQILKDSEEIAVPHVDLIDCAYPPNIGLCREELGVLRQKLERRRVEEWKSNEKGRKDRRQLRMLNN